MGRQDDDRCEVHRRHLALTGAYRAGDVSAVKAALGWPQDFPNCAQPFELACGDVPLVTAINLAPLELVRELLDLGADPNFEAADGFPSLFCAIDAPRPDAADVLELLLHRGARTDQRGINDWTPLHHAVARRYLWAVEALLRHGADPMLAARIDDRTSALEDAHAQEFADAADLMRVMGGRED